ncbi:hypothetical protein J3F83DRAFT_553630 [Trichoderma novae-zelandiae]
MTTSSLFFFVLFFDCSTILRLRLLLLSKSNKANDGTLHFSQRRSARRLCKAASIRKEAPSRCFLIRLLLRPRVPFEHNSHTSLCPDLHRTATQRRENGTSAVHSSVVVIFPFHMRMLNPQSAPRPASPIGRFRSSFRIQFGRLVVTMATTAGVIPSCNTAKRSSPTKPIDCPLCRPTQSSSPARAGIHIWPVYGGTIFIGACCGRCRGGIVRLLASKCRD